MIVRHLDPTTTAGVCGASFLLWDARRRIQAGTTEASVNLLQWRSATTRNEAAAVIKNKEAVLLERIRQARAADQVARVARLESSRKRLVARAGDSMYTVRCTQCARCPVRRAADRRHDEEVHRALGECRHAHRVPARLRRPLRHLGEGVREGPERRAPPPRPRGLHLRFHRHHERAPRRSAPFAPWRPFDRRAVLMPASETRPPGPIRYAALFDNPGAIVDAIATFSKEHKRDFSVSIAGAVPFWIGASPARDRAPPFVTPRRRSQGGPRAAGELAGRGRAHRHPLPPLAPRLPGVPARVARRRLQPRAGHAGHRGAGVPHAGAADPHAGGPAQLELDRPPAHPRRLVHPARQGRRSHQRDGAPGAATHGLQHRPRAQRVRGPTPAVPPLRLRRRLRSFGCGAPTASTPAPCAWPRTPWSARARWSSTASISPPTTPSFRPCAARGAPSSTSASPRPARPWTSFWSAPAPWSPCAASRWSWTLPCASPAA